MVETSFETQLNNYKSEVVCVYITILAKM